MTTHSTAFSETSAPHALKATSDGHTARETIGAAVPELKARARHLIEVGKDRVSEWTGGFQGGIREKPIQSVLIAAAVGAVIGLIFARRSS